MFANQDFFTTVMEFCVSHSICKFVMRLKASSGIPDVIKLLCVNVICDVMDPCNSPDGMDKMVFQSNLMQSLLLTDCETPFSDDPVLKWPP